MSHTDLYTALTTELATVTAELSTIANHNPDTDDWVAIPVAADMGNADENVAADVTEEWDTRRALLVQLETRYRNLSRALDKMQQGTYGSCEICSNPIEPARLAANPAARTCIAHLDDERTLPL